MEYSVVNESERDVEPFPFVYVEENGSFRELTKEEKQYLTEKFHPNDGDRPYVKSKYSSLTPDGKISGFCKRSKLPKNLTSGVVTQHKLRKWWQFW